MKRFLFMVMAMLVVTSAFAESQAPIQSSTQSKNTTDDLAFTRPGSVIFFQFGLFYSQGYGNIISQYDTQGIVPGSILAVSSMTRFGYGYNLTNNIGWEVAFSDNGTDFFEAHKDYVDSGTTQAEYNFDIYNLETAIVLKNAFADMSSEIHGKFGMAYTYGKQTVSYHTSAGSGPSWNNGQRQFQQQFHASGIAPLFGIGFGWSISRYLAYSLDYEHVFKPVIGNAHYNDPLNSSMQATNMWLLGATYNF